MAPGSLWWFCIVVIGFGVMLLFLIQSLAHMGYLHLVRIFLRCCSVLSSSGIEQTVLVLGAGVLKTLFDNLVVMTVPLQVLICWLFSTVLSCSGMMVVSRKDIEPSGHVSSNVNIMA